MEGPARLLVDDTIIIVSVKIWLDLVNNKKIESHKDKIKNNSETLWCLFITDSMWRNPTTNSLSTEEEEETEMEHNTNFLLSIQAFKIQDPDSYPKTMFGKEADCSLPHFSQIYTLYRDYSSGMLFLQFICRAYLHYHI